MPSQYQTFLWGCSSHPGSALKLEIPNEFRFQTGDRLSLARLVYTIYWTCPFDGHGDKWETMRSHRFSLTKAREQRRGIRNVMTAESLPDGYHELSGVSRPFTAFDIYTRDASTFNSADPHGIRGSAQFGGTRIELSVLLEVTHYEPAPHPPIVAYGPQGSVPYGTPTRPPNIAYTMVPQSFWGTPELVPQTPDTVTTASSDGPLSPNSQGSDTGLAIRNDDYVEELYEEEAPAQQPQGTLELDDNNG